MYVEMFQSLIGIRGDCNIGCNEHKRESFGFQSLIGIRGDCNLSSFLQAVSQFVLFQSLIGIRGDCNAGSYRVPMA